MKVIKRISKYLLWFFAGIIILLIGVFIFIQTDTFNNWALDYTLGKVNKSWETKNNKVTAESLTGNILKGIKLNTGAITIKGDTLVNFSSLEIKYDLWALLKHKISIDFVELNEPRIFLSSAKDKDGNFIWNYTRLFTPSTDTTPASPFDWDLAVNTFKIQNGLIRVAGDYTDTLPLWKIQRDKIKAFNLEKMDVTNLQMELSAKYYRDYKSVNIKNLSFNTNSDFNLKKLSLDAEININDNYTSVKNLEIITDRSNVKIEKLQMSDLNPLEGVRYDEFKNKNVELKLTADKFNFADLRFFLPQIDMLDSAVTLTLDASGKYSDLNINRLNLVLPNSNISLAGNVQHLDNPDSLYFDVTGNNIDLYPGDAFIVLNIPQIPDYSNLGQVQGNIYYRGTPYEFYSEFDLKTGAGYVNGYTNLNIQNEIYDGNITTHNLNLGKVLKDNKLNSNLNLSAKFDGSGFALNKISGHVIYSLDNSSMAGYTLSSTGDVKAKNSIVDLNIKATSGTGNLNAAGRINIANIKNPVYNVKGSFSRVDISRFTKNPGDKSNLNAAFDINGHGSSLENINGRYNFLIDNSFYSEYKIPRTPLNIDINNNGSQSSVKVITDMAELNVSGSFNIASLGNALKYNIASLSSAVKQKLSLDSTGVQTALITGSTNSGNVNLSYELAVKDTSKLNEVTAPFGIVFNGHVKGNIVNSPEGFSSTVLLDVKNFKYHDTSIVLKNVNSNLSFKNNYSTSISGDNIFSPYSILFSATGQQIKYDSSSIDSADIKFNMDNSAAGLSLKAKLDTTGSIRLTGKFDLSGEKITADIDTVKVKYGLYEIANNNNWVAAYLPGREIEFDKVSLKSKNAIVNISGNYSLNANSDLRIEANNLKLADIYAVVKPVDTTKVRQRKKYPIDGELAKLFINYKGTMENPEIEADINTNILKYGNDNIGDISAKIHYKDEMITPNIVFQNYNNKGNLTISGTMPFDNPLETKDTNEVFNNNTVAIKLDANDFQIEYFSKIIPGLGDISGILKGELSANGSASNPDLTGSLSMDNGSYFLPLTGMYYDFKFNASTADSKLLIDKFSLLNPDDDSKHFDLFGNIDFKGMKINNIDLTASGDMYVLDGTVEDNELGITGDIYLGSGTPPLTIKGNFDKLDIKGQLLVKEATIESVPLKGSGYDIGPDNFVYINASDTTFQKGDSLIAVGPKRFDKLNPFDKYKYKLSRVETSVWDFLNLDLNVKTVKDINIDVDFITLARSKLYGSVQADINLKTENKVLNAYGNVDVVGNSYFRLYRDFKLKDSRIVFNGPITNPALDLRAVYTGTKTVEQFGTISSIPVQVAAYVQGNVETPKISFKLIQDGDEVTGENSGGDAVTFLLFGKFRSDLTESQQSAMASGLGQSVGSYYASSYLTDALREVLPFIVGAEFKYSEGDVIKNSDIMVTSELGDATIKVGGHEVNSVNYLEFTIDYPISKLLNLNLPETLLLEIAREMLTYTSITTTDQQSRTGIKLIYKFRF